MIHITTDPERHLLIARWDSPGTDSSYLLDDRQVSRSKELITCWRWLVDFRLHGDLSIPNAKYFFELVLPDEAERLASYGQLRVATVLSPTFSVLPSSLPPPDFQHQHKFTVRAFMEEGAALEWLVRDELV